MQSVYTLRKNLECRVMLSVCRWLDGHSIVTRQTLVGHLRELVVYIKTENFVRKKHVNRVFQMQIHKL